LGKGDTLVVSQLDRLPCSLSQLVRLLVDLDARGAAFSALSDTLDTGPAACVPTMHVIRALVGFERALTKSRLRVGQMAAKRRGDRVGRRPMLTAIQIAQARHLVDAGESPGVVAAEFGVGRTTLWRALKSASTPR
jgi:DNA invertase Pin-like site-specific DNA recombinase